MLSLELVERMLDGGLPRLREKGEGGSGSPVNRFCSEDIRLLHQGGAAQPFPGFVHAPGNRGLGYPKCVRRLPVAHTLADNENNSIP